MLISFSLLSVLLFDIVFAEVCGKTRVVKKPGVISAASAGKTIGQNHCDVYISAPKQNFIILNLTEIYGFRHPTMATKDHGNSSADAPLGNCMPRLDIAEVASAGHYKVMRSICGGGNQQPLQVYRSRGRSLKLTYSWLLGHDSRFTVMVNFYPQPRHCRLNMTFECESRERCLFHKLVCDGVSHCEDSSDEANCPNSPTAQSPDVLIQAIVIAVVILFTLGMVVCVAYQCRAGRHALFGRLGQEGSSTEHHHLNTSTSQPITEVVYVPGSSQSSIERDSMASQRQHSSRHLSTEDPDMNYPPHIPISLDGEEGYQHSQMRLLQARDVSNQSFRPPPNRTIFAGEPPPPYRSNSVGLLDSCSDSSRSEYRHPYRDCGNSQYLLPSCQESENNNLRDMSWDSAVYPGVTGPALVDPYPVPSYQQSSAGQAQSRRTQPHTTLPVPSSGQASESPSDSSHEQLATVPLLPSYSMAVGQREAES